MTSIYHVPAGSVITIIGAGGKTTCVHGLADHYRQRGQKVLVTTTTKMGLEEPCASSLVDIKNGFASGNYVFAGTPIFHKGMKKIETLPEEVLRSAFKLADVTLIEGDGAARRSFKVPKDYEPVVPAETTHIIISAGMKAVGLTIEEGAYYPEGVVVCLTGGKPLDSDGQVVACRGCVDFPVDEGSVLTPALMAEAYKRTYVNQLRREHPEAVIYVMASQAEPEREAFADEFLSCFEAEPVCLLKQANGIVEEVRLSR
ncbi:MAG: selenium cofactor biosynthesis protein YqeC [Lachnospiraceae bacterium]|nr:selenium cofactor biosynthesis protein YqeC [Lachnospiraceae bacterium]